MLKQVAERVKELRPDKLEELNAALGDIVKKD
jgi:hypothetical protein